MTPQESRERFIDSIFSLDEVIYLKSIGLYDDYIEGRISIDNVYSTLKEQGI